MIRFASSFFFIFLVNYASAEGVFQANPHEQEKGVDLIIQKRLDYYDRYYLVLDSVKAGDSILLELKNYAESKQNYQGVLKVLYRLGKSYHVWHKDDVKAVNYFFESLKFSEKTGNQEYACKSYNYLGIIFYTNHKFKDAIKYFNFAIAANWDDEKGVKSMPYYLTGLSYFELDQNDKAMLYFDSALIYISEKDNHERINEIRLGQARVFTATKKYDNAKEILSNSLSYYHSENEPVALAVSYNLLSKISLSQNKVKEALHFSLLAYDISNNANDINSHKIDIAQQLHDIYARMGHTKEAYSYIQKVLELKNLATTLDITSQIALTHAQYKNEIERNNLNATIVKQEADKKTAMMAAGILGGLFLVIGVLLIFVRKERQKSENLILNILPAKTVQELKKFGKAIPTRHDAVSVMFCDVKEFSHLASTLEPENLISILDFYFSNFDRIIKNYKNIEKIKTIGDAYLCVSGLSDNVQHASDMVEAACEIVQFVSESKEEVKIKFGQSIEFRVDIHTGSLVSGVVGTHKYAYDVWGDTVNIAARLEGASEPGKINISRATYDIVHAKFKCDKRGVIEVKNGLKLEMYFVLGPI